MFEPVDKSLDIVKLEHRILAFWQESRAFAKLVEKNRGKPPWSFLDGPITADTDQKPVLERQFADGARPPRQHHKQ